MRIKAPSARASRAGWRGGGCANLLDGGRVTMSAISRLPQPEEVMISWGPFPLVANLIGAWPLAGPPLLVSLLFLLSWLYKPKLHASA